MVGLLGIDHSRPQSLSFLGHVVGYKLSRVSLGTRMGIDALFYGGAAWKLGASKILQLVEIPHGSSAYFMWGLSLPSRYPRHNDPASYASYCFQFPSKPTFTRLDLQP